MNWLYHSKNHLLNIIKQKKLENSSHFPDRIQQCSHGDHEKFVDNHLLLFTSALVPKALSSILTSLLIQIGNQQVNTSVLDPKDLSSIFASLLTQIGSQHLNTSVLVPKVLC